MAGATLPSAHTALKDQIRQGIKTDYLVVDLGVGDQWLSSRPFIFAAVLPEVVGLRACVFLESRNPTRVFIGTADIGLLRRRLAQRYPIYERAYTHARAQSIPPPAVAAGSPFFEMQTHQFVQLVEGYLRFVQWPAGGQPPVVDESDVVTLRDGSREHARWLMGAEIERLLGDDLNRSAVQASNDEEEVRSVIRVRGWENT
jgi:hypothetical protein